MKKIVFATHNQHKLDEIRKIVDGKFRLLSLPDIGCYEEIDETGSTLQENALEKVEYIHNQYGYDCFADDTGLEVEALNNAPGVYSARYAGAACRPIDNMEKLLREMESITNRRARFRTIIALILRDETHFFEGIINGKITTEKKGIAGFGYDPIFMPDGYDKTFAELGDRIKNSISHRSIATEKLVNFLLAQ